MGGGDQGLYDPKKEYWKPSLFGNKYFEHRLCHINVYCTKTIPSGIIVISTVININSKGNSKRIGTQINAKEKLPDIYCVIIGI